MAAVYFACSYWMDKYNLLRLFATRSASDCAVGAGIVRTLSIADNLSIAAKPVVALRPLRAAQHSTSADSEAVTHRACLLATAVALLYSAYALAALPCLLVCAGGRSGCVSLSPLLT